MIYSICLKGICHHAVYICRKCLEYKMKRTIGHLVWSIGHSNLWLVITNHALFNENRLNMIGGPSLRAHRQKISGARWSDAALILWHYVPLNLRKKLIRFLHIPNYTQSLENILSSHFQNDFSSNCANPSSTEIFLNLYSVEHTSEMINKMLKWWTLLCFLFFWKYGILSFRICSTFQNSWDRGTNRLRKVRNSHKKKNLLEHSMGEQANWKQVSDCGDKGHPQMAHLFIDKDKVPFTIL